MLKRRVARVAGAMQRRYVSQGEKYQHFIGFRYQAGSWHRSKQWYSKIESTGKGLNVRHIVSNLPGKTIREIYFDIYVQRGEASENRIEEVKNMCQSDRLSWHRYWGNFLRFLISSLAYELFLLLKQATRKTTVKQAYNWQIHTSQATQNRGYDHQNQPAHLLPAFPGICLPRPAAGVDWPVKPPAFIKFSSIEGKATPACRKIMQMDIK